jgi:CheY-like chemotaxis protein
MNAMLDRNPKILVVDDQPAIALTLATILESQGYETAVAHSGEEAIQVAYSYEPDFILSDVTMDGISGIEAVIRILGLQPRCKVLFFSGHATCLDLLGEARAQGFDFEVLAKPVAPTELLERIARVLPRPEGCNARRKSA